ncbi:cytochrome c-type biogenesis protein CcmH [Deinococcus sp. VB343]|uniref:cytochrome c-type biogenesis protein n=1 Tax=Deinococcus sp. VB343 TaxID=3385567 RepID=UPI0039C9D66D
MRGKVALLTAVLLFGGAGAQGATSTPAGQNATQAAPAQPAPENTDADGRNDSVGTGVAEVERTAPIPLTLEQERQAQRIGSKLHCPICSGESIAQSQTDISRQMMNEVRDGIRQGQSERQILERFVASYGERILMEPPRRGINWLLWGFPVGALLLGVGLWQGYLRRASRAPERTLTAEEERRIAELLRERQGGEERA